MSASTTSTPVSPGSWTWWRPGHRTRGEPARHVRVTAGRARGRERQRRGRRRRQSAWRPGRTRTYGQALTGCGVPWWPGPTALCRYRVGLPTAAGVCCRCRPSSPSVGLTGFSPPSMDLGVSGTTPAPGRPPAAHLAGRPIPTKHADRRTSTAIGRSAGRRRPARRARGRRRSWPVRTQDRPGRRWSCGAPYRSRPCGPLVSAAVCRSSSAVSRSWTLTSDTWVSAASRVGWGLLRTPIARHARTATPRAASYSHRFGFRLGRPGAPVAGTIRPCRWPAAVAAVAALPRCTAQPHRAGSSHGS